jgi:hypothetical protein
VSPQEHLLSSKSRTEEEEEEEEEDVVGVFAYCP